MSTKRRSPLRKLGIAVGLATASALALAGCTAGSGASSGGVETVTVMYASNEFTKDDVKEFEKENPKIKIKFIEFDQTRLNAMLTAGDPPDFVRGGPSANLFARGLATPLDDYMAKSKDLKASDLVAANDAWKWNGKVRGTGKTYGIIKDWSPDATIWQNTALFQKAGVQPFSTTEPASWDDLLAAAKRIQASGVATNALGLEWQWGVASLLQTMVLQQGGRVYNSDFTKVNLTSPEAIRAIQWLVDFGKAGVGPTSLNPLADGQDAPSFAAGKMAMSLDGYWFGGGLQGQDAAGVQKDISMIPAPTFDKRVSPIFGGIGAWIPSASKHKDAAWKVMEFFMAGKPAVERSKTGWGLPIVKSLWKNLPTTYQYQKDAIATAKGELSYVVPLADSPYIGDQWTQITDSELQAAIQGKVSVEDAAKAMESQLNTALAQGKDQLG